MGVGGWVGMSVCAHVCVRMCVCVCVCVCVHAGASTRKHICNPCLLDL